MHHVTYRYETKKELREAVRGKKVREVIVTGALSDTREIELRFDDNSTLTIGATHYGTLTMEG
jgi:hypothetical protein